MRTGISAGRMQFVSWGDGRRTLLYLPGAPGSSVPQGVWGRVRRKYFAPYIDEGYAVWMVTRPRHLPRGHRVADLAHDHRRFIDEHLGGRADLVIGESFGGLVAQHLAGLHPSSVGHLVLVASGVEESDWAKNVDRRLAAAVARGDRKAAGAAFAEYVLPSARAHRLRQVVGPLMARPVLWSTAYPPEDVVVELEAAVACDCRPVLPGIVAPTLIVAGDRDRFFPPQIIQETASLIPDCRVVRYPRRGHVATCSTSQVVHDVLGFLRGLGAAG